MKLLSKLLNKETRKCLICQKSLGKNFAEIQYKYDGGTGTAYACSTCGDELEKNRLERESNDDLAV
jgi:hypothetical protein